MKKHFTLIPLFLFTVSSFWAQDCPVPSASNYLHGNNIRAVIPGGGRLFFDGNNAGFEVSSQDAEPAHTIFAQGLWLGAVDAAGNLKVAAQTYGSDIGHSDTDYFAGPLDEAGAANEAACNQWDRVWLAYRYQIEAHLKDITDNGTVDTPIPEIMGWPGAGNPYFADIYGFELPGTDQGLAPFMDSDNDGIYDPMAGDHPAVLQSSIIPEQITWSIFNDAGGIHAETGGEPLQVEVHLATWAYFCEDNPQLNNTVFTSYKLINRGEEALDSLHLGIWLDYDLGCFIDDYIGSAPALNTVFAYNSDNDDELNCESSGVTGFGENPPVQAMIVLNQELSYATYYCNGSVGMCRTFGPGPGGWAQPYYQLLTGSFLFFGGDGANPNNPPTNFAFPGDPNNPEEWSMVSASSALESNDYKVLGSIRLGNLAPGAAEQVDAAYSFFREPGASHLENVTAMYTGIEDLQSWYNGRFEDICSQPACEEDCVWPGDANADGIANYYDLLAIAVGENAQGPGRDGPNTWAPWSSEDWVDVQANGANYKHIDANGNGTVTFEDFLVSGQHYNRTEPGYQPPVAEYREGPELNLSAFPFQFDFNNLSAGQSTNTGRIQLTETVPGLYALAFSLEYDTAYFEYIRSTSLSTAQYGFDINRRYFATSEAQPAAPGQFDFALAATDDIISDGVLGVGLLQLKVKDAFSHPLPSNTTQIRFKNIKAIQRDGTEIEIGGTTITATFPEIMVDTEEPPQTHGIHLFPNPTRGPLELYIPEQRISMIELYDTRGRQLWKGAKGRQERVALDLSHLPEGIYFLRVGSWVEKVVIGR
ncbi:MAG: T9SS type A sorting domain-containing protein [Phaeodactylibacter sp.]|nr:T9SS type A sorting domain-containing protein [Phaeodactylibacter sp.]